MAIEQRFANHEGIRIEYYDGNEEVNEALTPLLHLPGAMGGGDTFLPEIPKFAGRRCIAMSQRGRGQSDAPETGYKLDKYVGDVEAVLDHAGVESVLLYAFSQGVPTAIAFAAAHPERVKGLVIGDYPAQYVKLPPEWVDKYTKFPPGTVNMTAVRGVVADSEDISLWERLTKITCPVLILQGGRTDVQLPAMLKAEDAQRYQAALADVRVEVFEESGHRLWEPDPERYIRVIREFLEGVERGGNKTDDSM